MKKLLIIILSLGSLSAFADPYYWIDAYFSGCLREIKKELKRENIDYTKIKVDVININPCKSINHQAL